MIVVDSREKHIDRIQELIAEVPEIYIDKLPQFEFRCLGTDLGDYLLENGGNQIGIERKNMNDFCGSYHGLKSRLHKMRLHYERVGLLLEGQYKVANNQVYVQEGNEMVPRMTYSTFVHFMVHQNDLHTHIYRTQNFDESFYQLIEIHDYLPQLNTPDVLKCGNVTEWVMQLPGVGKVAIQKMKKTYSSPLEAINNLPKKAKDLLEKW